MHASKQPNTTGDSHHATLNCRPHGTQPRGYGSSPVQINERVFGLCKNNGIIIILHFVRQFYSYFYKNLHFVRQNDIISFGESSRK
jgi:hypothetical protein